MGTVNEPSSWRMISMAGPYPIGGWGKQPAILAVSHRPREVSSAPDALSPDLRQPIGEATGQVELDHGVARDARDRVRIACRERVGLGSCRDVEQHDTTERRHLATRQHHTPLRSLL